MKSKSRFNIPTTRTKPSTRASLFIVLCVLLFAGNEMRCAKYGCISRVGFYGEEDGEGGGGGRGGFVGGGAVIGSLVSTNNNGGSDNAEGKGEGEVTVGQISKQKLHGMPTTEQGALDRADEEGLPPLHEDRDSEASSRFLPGPTLAADEEDGFSEGEEEYETYEAEEFDEGDVAGSQEYYGEMSATKTHVLWEEGGGQEDAVLM